MIENAAHDLFSSILCQVPPAGAGPGPASSFPGPVRFRFLVIAFSMSQRYSRHQPITSQCRGPSASSVAAPKVGSLKHDTAISLAVSCSSPRYCGSKIHDTAGRAQAGRYSPDPKKLPAGGAGAGGCRGGDDALGREQHGAFQGGFREWRMTVLRRGTCIYSSVEKAWDRRTWHWGFTQDGNPKQGCRDRAGERSGPEWT